MCSKDELNIILKNEARIERGIHSIILYLITFPQKKEHKEKFIN